MWYGTHAIAPMTVLSGSRIKRVNCFGSGTMEESLTKQYRCSISGWKCIIQIWKWSERRSNQIPVCGCPSISGRHVCLRDQSKLWMGGYWWWQPLCLYQCPSPRRLSWCNSNGWYCSNAKLPSSAARKHSKIHRRKELWPAKPQDSLKKGSGGGHHGSHPHLVHEFVTSILEDRKPWIDEVLASNICCWGLCPSISACERCRGWSAVVLSGILLLSSVLLFWVVSHCFNYIIDFNTLQLHTALN